MSEAPEDDLPEEYPEPPKPTLPPHVGRSFAMPPVPTEMSSDSTSDSGDRFSSAPTPPPPVAPQLSEPPPALPTPAPPSAPRPVGDSVYGPGPTG